MSNLAEISFAMPAGVRADIAELEYISALHQSGDKTKLRKDGSIQAKDIVNFLKSRHGVVVSEEDVAEKLLHGLSLRGDSSSSTATPSTSLDLAEVVSLLFLPSALQFAHARNEATATALPAGTAASARNLVEHAQKKTNLQEDAVQDLFDVFFENCLSAQGKDDNDKNAESLPLTPELVRELLASCGVGNVPKETVDSMIKAAAPDRDDDEEDDSDVEGGLVLSRKTLMRALTKDLQRHARVWTEKTVVATYFDGVHESLKTQGVPPLPSSSPTATTNASAPVVARASTTSSAASGGNAAAVARPAVVARATTSDSSASGGSGPAVARPAVVARAATPGSSGSSGNTPAAARAVPARASGVATAVTPPPLTSNNNNNDVISRADTSASIDFIAPSVRSVHVSALILFTAVVLYYAFGGSLRMVFSCQSQDPNSNQETEFSATCELRSSLLQWLFLIVVMGTAGSGFVYLSSQGNSIFPHSMPWIIGAIVMSGIISLGLLLFLGSVLANSTVIVEEWTLGYTFLVAMVTVVSLLVMQVRAVNSVNAERQARQGGASRPMGPTGLALVETRTKHSATIKMNRMLTNAVKVHAMESAGSTKSDDDQKIAPAHSYGSSQREEPETEQIGGVQWTWTKVRSGELASEYGISLSAFTLAINATQMFTCVWFLLNVYQLIVATEEAQNDENLGNFVDAVFISQAAGSLVGIGAALFLTVTHVPLVVSLKLKLRSGLIPTLHDDKFSKERIGAAESFVLLGATFWATFYSASLTALLIAIPVFFLSWTAVSALGLSFFAGQLGSLAGLLLLRLLVWRHIHNTEYNAFHRIHPGRSNMFSVVMTSVYIALGYGQAFGRAIKLMLLSTIYTGRLEIPFLAPGVGEIGPVELDKLPDIFLRGVCLEEAHTHPYMQRLGEIYLLKLHDSDRFVTREGSCWRLLFVLTVMPWLQMYRIGSLSYVGEGDAKTGGDFGATAKRFLAAIPNFLPPQAAAIVPGGSPGGSFEK